MSGVFFVMLSSTLGLITSLVLEVDRTNFKYVSNFTESCVKLVNTLAFECKNQGKIFSPMLFEF